MSFGRRPNEVLQPEPVDLVAGEWTGATATVAQRANADEHYIDAKDEEEAV